MRKLDFASVFLRCMGKMMDVFFKRPIYFTKKKSLIRKNCILIIEQAYIFLTIQIKRISKFHEIEFSLVKINFTKYFNITKSAFFFHIRLEKANRKHFPRLRVQLVHKPQNFVRRGLYQS